MIFIAAVRSDSDEYIGFVASSPVNRCLPSVVGVRKVLLFENYAPLSVFHLDIWSILKQMAPLITHTCNLRVGKDILPVIQECNPSNQPPTNTASG
jgi:hypothetical protein